MAEDERKYSQLAVFAWETRMLDVVRNLKYDSCTVISTRKACERSRAAFETLSD